MKIAICTTTYNRREYVKRMVNSLCSTLTVNNTDIKHFVRDDMSSELELSIFDMLPWPVVKNRNLLSTQGPDRNTLLCFEDTKEWDPDLIINLDSDMIVKPNWLQVMLDVWQKYSPKVGILSGFNTLKNHAILETRDDVYVKNTLGGAGIMVTGKFLREINLLGQWDSSWGRSTLGWDFKILEAVKAQDKLLLCTKPSVLQHIGTYGVHTPEGSGITVDVAEDFEEDCPLANRHPDHELEVRDKSGLY